MMNGNNAEQPFKISFFIRRQQLSQERDRIKVEINVKIKCFLLKITRLRKKTFIFSVKQFFVPREPFFHSKDAC